MSVEEKKLMKKTELKDLLLSLHKHVEENGIVGCDPILFWFFPMYKKYNEQKTFFYRVMRKIESSVLDFFPCLLKPYQKVCGIKDVKSPYGVALFAQAYLKLAVAFSDERFLQLSEKYAAEVIDLLIETKSGGMGLGDPIGKPDVVYLPASSEGAYALLDLYKYTKKDKYLNFAEKIGKAFCNDFLQKKVEEDGIALDYSSDNDRTHVLNANSLAAGVLAELDLITQKEVYGDLISKILNFLTPYISKPSIPYAGKEDSANNKFWNTYDVYHTGFTLRGVRNINKKLKSKRYTEIITLRIQEMMKDFLNDRTLIVHIPKTDVLDIHGVAEYILISSLSYEETENFGAVIEKNIRYMYNGGTFFYRRGYRDVALYMPRWGHAPMMNAMSSYLLAKQQKDRNE